MPFLRAAAARDRVTLLARPHAAPLLARFAPAVELVPFTAPWTAFEGKYRLERWSWGEMNRLRRNLRARRFDAAVSARPDPREHLLLAAAGARRRLGFPRAGSRFLLHEALPSPARPHRAEHWNALAVRLGLEPLPGDRATPPAPGRVVIHTGAAQSVRRWPAERFAALAARLRTAGWEVVMLDDSWRDLEALLDALAGAARFIGNDSGPGHLAALLGVPTFTIFGPQLPEFFAPRHPQSGWVDGHPCPYKPCFDDCRFSEPHCLLSVSVEEVWPRLEAWLASG